MTRKGKFLLVSTLVTCLFATTVISIGSYLAKRLNNVVLNLSENISKEIGHTVLIDDVSIKWDLFLLRVNINNIKILDKNTNAPLFLAHEIVSTVDTLDSILSFGLKFKNLLLRNPRLVVHVTENLQPEILGLSNSDVSGEIKPEFVLKVLAMQRHIVIEGGDLHIQGCDGADLPFMDLRIDFSQIADKEYSLVARGNIAAALSPEFVFALSYQGEITDISRATFDFEVKTNNVQLLNFTPFIPNFKQYLVSGDFTDFDIHGMVSAGMLQNISGDFTINELNIGSTVINGGIGHLEYKPGQNKANLQLSRLNIQDSSYFSHPLIVDSIDTDINYKILDTGIEVDISSSKIKFLDLLLEPKGKIVVADNKLTELATDFGQPDIPVRKLLSVLPDKKLSPGLCEWLKNALKDGDVVGARLSYQPEDLIWTLNFSNAELKFAPLWPSINSIDATLVMNNNDLRIVADKAKVYGADINNLQSTYKSFDGKPYTAINVTGDIVTTATDVLHYLHHTPLNSSLAMKLDPYYPGGEVELGLSIDVNVSKPELSVWVAGDCVINDGSIDIPELATRAQNIQGLFKFDNEKFSANDLKVKLFEQEGLASLSSILAKGNMQVEVDIPLAITTVQKIIPALDFSRVTGITDVNAHLDLPLNDGDVKHLSIETNLQGYNIDYPAPFGKEIDTITKFALDYKMYPSSNDIVQFKYGKSIESIIYLTHKQFQGGKIAINNKLGKVVRSNDLLISGEINDVDWSKWEPIIKNQATTAESNLNLDLTIKNLQLAGSIYKPVKLKYEAKTNKLYIDTSILTGTIINNMQEKKIDVSLDRLHVQNNSMKNDAILNFVNARYKEHDLPIVYFKCKTLQFDNKNFRKVHLDLQPRLYGYEITDLSITNENIVLKAQGKWDLIENSHTTLEGNIATQNFGQVLSEWGYENSISRGRGEMSFAVHWEGGPIDFDVLKLEGSSHLDLRYGSLTNVNPGIGRIIGLLSLESIHRRLQLDFSDILSKGFAFDKLVADFKILPGSVKSDNILINSPSAKIELFGKTAIKSQNLDFTMFVTPKVGVTLPIAAAVAAWNPAVGAAIWLVDKASGSKISEITKYKYKVTGTWGAPQVDELPTSVGKVIS